MRREKLTKKTKTTELFSGKSDVWGVDIKDAAVCFFFLQKGENTKQNRHLKVNVKQIK